MALDLLSKICREIDGRLDELRPLRAEHERLLNAAAALEAAGSGTAAADTFELLSEAQPTGSDTVKPRAAKPVRASRAARSVVRPKPEPAARSAAGSTILAALDHGSHTVGELAVVTAMSGPSINGNLRKLVSEGVVVKTEREGKAAWALAATA
jgi:hypothetical protein